MTINKEYLYTEKARARGVSHYNYIEIIQSIIKEIPELTSEGFGLSEEKGKICSEEEKRAKLEKARQNLFSLASENAFWACCEYIQFLRPSKNISPGAITSYNLKHRVEKWTDLSVYVFNGVFIAAAIHSDLQFKHIKNSTNMVFNITEKSCRCWFCGNDQHGSFAHA